MGVVSGLEEGQCLAEMVFLNRQHSLGGGGEAASSPEGGQWDLRLYS